MIIDFHTHTGGAKIKCSLGDIAKSMVQNGIDLSVVFPVTQANDGGIVEESQRNLREADERFLCFLRFNPTKIDTRELAKMAQGFRGFKLHPRGDRFDPLDPGLKGIFEAVQKIGKPVIIHSRKENYSYSDPDRLVDLAGLYPKINFVFGHFADDSDIFFERISEFSNAFVETSIVSSPKIIEMRANKIGADKIIFGSDFPFSDQEIELMKIKKSKLSDKEKEMILYENALRLLSNRKDIYD